MCKCGVCTYDVGEWVGGFGCAFTCARHWAAIGGFVPVAEALLDSSAGQKLDINAKTKSGYTALHLCSEAGKLELVNWLLAHRADPLIKDGSTPEGGKTAWDLAKEKGHAPVMNALKEKGGATEGGGCCVIS